MKKETIIGIPRAFLYFKYKYLWETFFKELNCKILISPETNRKILKDGIANSIDESCLSSKIYMGHVYYLIDKVDYILVPRIVNFGKKDVVCTKFNALYDIVNNTFRNVKLLDYNIDIEEKQSEFKGFMKMGRALGKDYIKVLKAYLKAKKMEDYYNHKKVKVQEELLENSDKLKILIVSHPYNIYDKLIGYPIIKFLESFDVVPIYSDVANKEEVMQRSKEISKTLYWIYNKELIGAMQHYINKIDGIIFLSTFPCGPDSLVTELCLRKIKGIPMTNIILDELQGEAGIYTRIESFIDIIKERNNRRKITNGK
ncbi:Predicted nucleotide-binding protein, sugar kinase/HSP70/actin superfamily [Clostridium cavendishii DSM 21758]|uniref:Predicted nucleotide-binding protein, sugar kinase/HSP70/actin superfamily n=1 Tax=Clostridium cavendishii DSM 21758 TaxID=1121302 RepID=A0A1M6FFI5_9CLOT|nr:acyl-CoA dehydratase activase-related protein [Clostridium cavendishii]SHI96419.1 Predicted nucleotide-binding protein, sugar kinase/HSP70/actin superfamily [Clostridium cavendishii DSM 21758]